MQSVKEIGLKILNYFALYLILPALCGIIGVWYGASLTHEQWKHERTIDAYSLLLNAVDEAVFITAEIPAEYRLAKMFKAHKMESEAMERIRRAQDDFKQLVSLLSKVNTSSLVIQKIRPNRHQAANWRGQFTAIVKSMSTLSIQAAEGDTSAHRAAQQSLDRLREEIFQGAQEDFEVKRNAFN